MCSTSTLISLDPHLRHFQVLAGTDEEEETDEGHTNADDTVKFGSRWVF